MNTDNLPSLRQLMPNLTEVVIGKLTLYYSYETIIGFSHPRDPRVVQVNRWSKTTGKHLNYIDNGNKKTRVGVEEFAQRLEAVLSPTPFAEPYTLEELRNS